MTASAGQIARIEEKFAERMTDSGIRLPEGAAQGREGGHIFEKGWHIGYVWGDEDGEEYLELLVQHMAMDDAHVRWWASGREEQMPAPSEWIMIPPDVTAGEMQKLESGSAESNQQVYQELRERGLLPPEGDNLGLMEVNEFVNSGGMSDADKDGGDRQMATVDGSVQRWVQATAATLEKGDEVPLELREHHLASALKDAINAERPGCATTKVLRLDAWPSLGRSTTDVVVADEQDSCKPSMVFELKWCQQGQDKIHEAIWDLFKVALLVDEYQAEGYVMTAAPAAMWPLALCGELFSPSTHSSTDLFREHFPNGRPVWDWLLEGGCERYPAAVPETIALVEAGRTRVSFGTLEWEVRAVRVLPASVRLPLKEGWPVGGRPALATHPATSQ